MMKFPRGMNRLLYRMILYRSIYRSDDQLSSTSTCLVRLPATRQPLSPQRMASRSDVASIGSGE
jgi:hypothetical protein